MRRATGAALLLFLSLALLALGGCASPPPTTGTRVILLPQPDGSGSAVIVTGKAGEQRLSQPYQRATARDAEKAAPQVDSLASQQVAAQFKPLFETAPPKPQRYTLYFQTGNTTLMPESQALLPTVINEALKRSGAELVIIGHTDTMGSQDLNDGLSLKRAGLVVDMLKGRNFPPSRIEAVGRGERELAVPTRDEVPEPRNRRVEILIR
ncbi:MAG TPA: OmpA family protein [Burkholderiales bacterium]|jgi:outer membrane protein OmpA-like peptidoglycan-associated protein|nr:OmpA family protein [Burkholderiales bacterium]